MELLKNGIIYSRHSPPIDVEKEMQAAEEFCHNNLDYHEILPPSIEEILAVAEVKYNYERRADALEASQTFAELVIGLSEAYEISLDLTKYERYICATMDIAFGSYSGGLKNRLDALMAISDSVSLFCNKSKTDYIVTSIDYYLYDRYKKDTGEKVEW